MHTVSKRTLNQDTAGVLETVTQTGGVVVTERGTPRWYVSPYIAPENPLARLEKRGATRPQHLSPRHGPNVQGALAIANPKSPRCSTKCAEITNHGDYLPGFLLGVAHNP